MDGSYIGVSELSHIVQHWSFIVTLIVLILAGVALETMGRDHGLSVSVKKKWMAFLIASACWGVYFVVHIIIFSYKFWRAMFTNAGPSFAFMVVAALVSGFWLVAVGISLAMGMLRRGHASQNAVRIRRAALVTIGLSAAWVVCCSVVFTSMYAYIYLSTIGLLLLGLFGISEALRGLLKEHNNETHMLTRLVGLLSVSLGIFAFIGVFYRHFSGESWSVIIRQLLTALSFGGVGILLLCRRWRVLQLVLSSMAVFVVFWRISICVYGVPELSGSMNGAVRSARQVGCGRYDRMAYFGGNEKPMDLVEAGSYGCGTPDCESIPVHFQVTREGVVLYVRPAYPPIDLALQLGTDFYDGLRWGGSDGLLLAVEKNVRWKTLVSLVATARQYGNHRVFFLCRKPAPPFDEILPEHRMRPWVKDVLNREDISLAGKRILCIKKLYTIDTYCPQIRRELSGEHYADAYELMEIINQALQKAALGCLGDVDLYGVDLLYRCMNWFEPLCVVDTAVAGPDDPWAREIALPADMPWEDAHKHLLKAIADLKHKRQPRPPLRFSIEEKAGK